MLKTKQIVKFTVSRFDEGVRLSSFVRAHVEGNYSLSAVKRAIDRCAVQVNGHTECFSSYKVAYGDELSLDLEVLGAAAELAPIRAQQVLYEDEQLLIFDKAPGVVCDEEELSELFPNTHLVHRLDKETSGVVALAKTPLTKNYMEELFRKREVKKDYLAIVVGEMGEDRGVIDNPLQKIVSYDGQSLWGAAPKGRGLRAVTYWQRLKWGGGLSLVRCQPKTGRTHQIRVHLSHIGYPLLGDRQYGRDADTSFVADRHLLHAKGLSFIHPVTGELIRVESAVPPDMQAAIETIENSLKT
ncbi:MAG: RluA family pseudouridine synthase [Chlamydiia bacterium]|nr:RluA family pseudouridine synthase [Chlamydiia bacterium]MCP5491740.1 RluA family pseudouridine synthase [Chlamydiales bacterium]